MGAATAGAFTGTAESHAVFRNCHAQATAASHTLRNHALGLIGLGNIGQQIAAKLGCPAFGMRVHYFDVLRKAPDVESRLGATFHDSLESLMATADCVVLCTPANADGTPLITKDTLKHFRPGSRFVNIARGSLVDDDTIADALDQGILSAAALDVHPDEPNVNPRLVRMAGVGEDTRGQPGRVMLTCHNAGGTLETHAGFEELSMRNIMAVVGGGDAITPVNLHWLKR